MFNEKEYFKNYYQINKEKILLQSKAKYIRNREIIKEQRKINKLKESPEDRIKRLEFHKNYNRENKSNIAKYRQTDNSKFMQYKFSAKRRNYLFDLTFEQFTSLFHSDCAYCGTSECRGIDRIDNIIGYTIKNSTPCCEICNKMKWKFSKEQFINQVMKINKNLSN